MILFCPLRKARLCAPAAALSVLVVAEWLYLDWAFRAPQPLPDNFVHAEWITLHDNPVYKVRSQLLPHPGQASLTGNVENIDYFAACQITKKED